MITIKAGLRSVEAEVGLRPRLLMGRLRDGDRRALLVLRGCAEVDLRGRHLAAKVHIEVVPDEVIHHIHHPVTAVPDTGMNKNYV